jgi:branched-chain amino acid transport system substrate-binding protein
MQHQHLNKTILAVVMLFALAWTACAPAPTATVPPPTATVPAPTKPAAPTTVPTIAPTTAPTIAPTTAPTIAPTTAPTAAPTTAPTAVPATKPPAVAVPGVTDTEIVIGSWGPQDGPAGAYGVIDRVIAAYFKMVNEQGGINGRKVRFIYENDSYQPAKTVAAVKKLVEEDKVFALTGGLGTANNLAVMDYLVQNNVPHLGPATGSGAMAMPVKKNVFQVQINYTVEGILLTQYALDNFKSKKFAVFYQNDVFGQEGLAAVNAELKKRGVSEAVAVSYEAADTNFAAQALKLQTSGADTVILYAVPKPGASIIAEMTKIGFKPNVLASAIINDPAIFQLAGPGIEGVITDGWMPQHDDTTDPKIVEYQAFLKKYAPNEASGGFALTGHLYGHLMTEALKRTGKDLTREKFIQTLDQLTDYRGSLVPSLTYTPTDHAGTKSAYFMKGDVKAGQFVKITGWITMK